ncbi:hypothetical protein [[Pantoea] beijingensis]|uniref:hypothetical protein n=1 Tax=[Pantoea] beijingensis TaxID=1324864 RepID=UPI0012B06DAF|nr:MULTISPECIES: hypothetical protein [Erwiniaceae]
MLVMQKMMREATPLEMKTMKAPLLLRLFSRSPFTLRLMLLEMLTAPKNIQDDQKPSC